MIGVQIQNVDRAMAQSLGLPRSGGALVNKITPGSGADKADVHVGDVILAYDGHDIELSSDLPPLVGSTKPGNKAEIKLFRDGKTMAVPVTVGAVPENGKQLASLERGDGKSGNALGIVVDSLTAEQRKQLALKDDQGVVITDIRGAARRSPLQPGDVVLMVGRIPVKSAGDFNDAVKDVKAGESVMLLVRREDVTQFVAVTVPTSKG
jgi:serine protease Do